MSLICELNMPGILIQNGSNIKQLQLISSVHLTIATYQKGFFLTVKLKIRADQTERPQLGSFTNGI